MAVRDLTAQQARFVEEYLLDLNATQAAIRAGYSPRSAEVEGSRLLRNAKVADEVARAKAERSARVQLHADRVLEELAALAFAHMGQYARWHDDSVSLIDSDQVDHRAVSEVRQQATRNGPSISIKLYDKVGALKLLGQHLGILTDSVTVAFDVDQVARELAEKYGTTPERVVSIVERLRKKQAG